MVASADFESWIGRTVADRYEITSRLGQGGMGTVFRARDTRLNSEVVLKVPHPAFLAADETFGRRFAREARSLVSLAHPHVVGILNVGETEGLPFLVMPYLGGGSLNDRRTCDNRGEFKPAKPRTLNDWLNQITRALDFIHQQGFVHRDVKPENILFDKHQSPYLSDFGIAKAVGDGTARQTNLTGGGVIGTPGYIAPEILLGKKYDGRSDQYSLAVTVYELLAGRRPFTAATPEAVIAAQLTEQIPDLRDTCPDLPRALCEAVKRALQSEPEKRFADCGTFAAAVEDALSESDHLQLQRSGRTTEGTVSTPPLPPLPAKKPASQFGATSVEISPATDGTSGSESLWATQLDAAAIPTAPASPPHLESVRRRSFGFPFLVGVLGLILIIGGVLAAYFLSDAADRDEETARKQGGSITDTGKNGPKPLTLKEKVVGKWTAKLEIDDVKLTQMLKVLGVPNANHTATLKKSKDVLKTMAREVDMRRDRTYTVTTTDANSPSTIENGKWEVISERGDVLTLKITPDKPGKKSNTLTLTFRGDDELAFWSDKKNFDKAPFKTPITHYRVKE